MRKEHVNSCSLTDDWLLIICNIERTLPITYEKGQVEHILNCLRETLLLVGVDDELEEIYGPKILEQFLQLHPFSVLII